MADPMQLEALAGLGGLASLPALSQNMAAPQGPAQGSAGLPEDYMPMMPDRQPMGPEAYNRNYFIGPQQVQQMSQRQAPEPEADPNLAHTLTGIIKQRESNGNYQAVNPRSSASGAYQYTDSTWNGYGGYPKAALAPPQVQDAKFAHDVAARLAAYGNDPYKAIVAHYLPALANQPNRWDKPFRVGGRVVQPALTYLRYVVKGTPLESGLNDYLARAQQPELVADAG
jgi:hypothetical protein